MRVTLLFGIALACAGADYVDPASCAQCHSKIAENYARTGMGQSFRLVKPGISLPEFDSGRFDHTASGQHFTTSRRDGRFYVRRHQTAPDGKDTNVLQVQVDYVIGSGNRARSYLHRTRDNKLVEFPVSWFPDGSHWEMSPGYDRPGHEGFSREINYRCMFCHNGYPDIAGMAAGWSGATDFPAQLPEGIDCQRCHGPGGAHVEAAKKGAAAQAIRAAIVNPARLNPERRMEVCMQCHLETTTAPLPGALLRTGRNVFSYRPGEPLGDYILNFDHPPGAGHDDKFEIVSAAYRFRKSACFTAGDGRFGCTSCHDPHQAASRQEVVQKTDSVCQGCHAESLAKRRHLSGVNCVACHMPQRRPADSVHMLMTDHRIVRRPEKTIEATDGPALPYADEVALYYPKALARTPENALYLAIAQVKDMSNLPQGLERLEKAIAQYRPGEGRPYYELGQALLNTRQITKALPFFEEAVKRDSREWRYSFTLGQAWMAAGQPGRAVDFYSRAQELAPGQVVILDGLGSAYARQGNLASAAASFRQALSSNPENGEAHAHLGATLLREGDLDAAERSLREAVRLRPEIADIRINLAVALIKGGKLREAKLELEEALQSGPSIEVARSAWFTALAAGGSKEVARARYDTSLRTQLAPAHANLGTVLALLGDSEGAIGAYRLAVSSDPQSAAACLNLALALADRGNSAEAQKLLEDALRIAPDLAAAHLKLGEILVSEGQIETGTAHIKRAAELSTQR